MLSLLHIENIAVIERADISFDGGFNALTGETGAGKSIVIDAISAVTGQRTSRELIRTGAKGARVEAVFCGISPTRWMEESGVSPDENGELLLCREILSDGKNICRAGERLLTVSQLKALGSRLVNIHGQHDGQLLLDEAYHLEYLDRFGALEADLGDYQEAYGILAGIEREISALEMDEAQKARRTDSLRYQIDELERAGLKPGEDKTLAEKRNFLRSAGKLVDAVELAYGALSGDEEHSGAVALLQVAETALGSGASLSENLSNLSDKASELSCAAADLAELVRDFRAELDVSPGELDQVESRLDVIYRLRKKYGDTVEEMLSYLERCKKELEEILCADDTLLKLGKKRDAALVSAKSRAEALSGRRKEAAARLRDRVQSELFSLDMPKVRFEAEFTPKGGKWGMDASGMDEVRFLMSANLGEALRPIQKIASGGELARIMLALKNVLAENDDVNTLVFDEVDTGVSGRAAQRVAEKLAQVSVHKQVLCVTHLPQLAAMADTHFAVEKGERDGRTFTAVERLDDDGRKNALARLTGGDSVSDSMRKSAGELLDAARSYKNSITSRTTD
ncbi:DNA repair protein RecN [bioreactor metagenome]|uniref:DNA repair protein RecN n=1 Tax=bioreactor metagenome TaxID=1076179 RepID=A0A644WZF4_9ZZZZ